jgi:hypothetical protein
MRRVAESPITLAAPVGVALPATLEAVLHLFHIIHALD